MPDDMRDLAEQRGAKAVTLRFRPHGANTTQRHAAWRVPLADGQQPRIDQIQALQGFDPEVPPPASEDLRDIRAWEREKRRAEAEGDRLYQNACAVMELCHAAGLFRSKGVAEWMRIQMGRSNSLDATPEDELRQLIRDGGVEFQAVLMLIDPEEPPVLPYMWSRALRGLARLDHVAARWDGERWGEE